MTGGSGHPGHPRSTDRLLGPTHTSGGGGGGKKGCPLTLLALLPLLPLLVVLALLGWRTRGGAA